MCTYFSEKEEIKKVPSTNVVDRKRAVLPSEVQTRGLKGVRWKINIHIGAALSCQSSLELICLSQKCHSEKRGGKLYLGKTLMSTLDARQKTASVRQSVKTNILFLLFPPQLAASELSAPDLKT